MTYDTWNCQEIGFKIPELSKLVYFLETYCKEEITELVSIYPEKLSICIKLTDVLKFSQGLEKAIINRFTAISIILQKALADTSFVKFSSEHINTNKIEFRIHEVPSMYKKTIRELNGKDLNKLVCVEGFVKSSSDNNPAPIKAVFQCLRCGHENVIVYQRGQNIEEPLFCENETCGKKGPFKWLQDKFEYEDFQRIQLQESPDTAKGTKAYSILVECYNDLTGLVEPGDKITVTGILKAKPKSTKGEKCTFFQKVIEPLTIEKRDVGFEEYILTKEDEEEIIELSKDLEIKSKVCRSIAPFIDGYEEEKEGLALLLFSGVKKELPDGTFLRGNINIALIGDPGVAKSLLVKWTVTISPRGVFTSGRTTSAAGLTAAVVKDPLGEGWVIEGGAAVMASGGVLAIDEIGQAKEEEKSALHEVMEQGCVTISKAAIVATLQADCSVLAAGNPKAGFFDRYESLPKQIDIPPALWSRFDLIFVVYDNPNESYDKKISAHILRNHYVGGIVQNKKRSKNPIYKDEDIKKELQTVEAPISKELLKKYIAYARSHVFPVCTKDIRAKIQEFYINIRKLKTVASNAPVPITARSLEAIQRLAEASARMRLSDIVTEEDVVFATKLMLRSLRDVGVDENGTLDANLLIGLQSKSQHDKIKWITKILDKGRTETETIELMKVDHKVPEDQTKSLIKKLIEHGKIAVNPSGYLEVIR